MTIPGLAGGAVGTQYDWNLTYATNEFVGNRAVSIPQGKVVGGSTKLNRMVFDRGSKADYDAWGTLGNEGWQWDSLLPYFQKVGILYEILPWERLLTLGPRPRHSRRPRQRFSPSTTSPGMTLLTAPPAILRRATRLSSGRRRVRVLRGS